MSLEEVVSRAQWCHNTNVMKSGFLPMQILAGKAVAFPDKTERPEKIEVSEHIKIMLEAQSAFRQAEYQKNKKSRE